MSVFNEIADEVDRQLELWGIQEHPDLDPVLMNRKGGCTPERMAEEYEIPSEARAKSLCEIRFSKGQGTWGHILVEELAEAIGTNGDDERLRAELIQVAAVACSWVLAIDRR